MCIFYLKKVVGGFVFLFCVLWLLFDLIIFSSNLYINSRMEFSGFYLNMVKYYNTFLYDFEFIKFYFL